MLKYIFQIILLFLIIRLLFPMFKGVGKTLGRLFKPPPRSGGGGKVEKEPDYSALSPYEIEDADYEEVKGDGE